jgi:hypothetical protein
VLIKKERKLCAWNDILLISLPIGSFHLIGILNTKMGFAKCQNCVLRRKSSYVHVSHALRISNHQTESLFYAL